jgi:23S rRNA (uracil1939-C5)-methyltransferase
MDSPWRYRNHIRLRTSSEGVGYYAVDGGTVVPIDVCPIAHPLVEELLPLARGLADSDLEVSLRAGIRSGDQLIVLHADVGDIEAIEVETEVPVAIERADGSVDAAAGVPVLTEVLAGQPFIVPATAFFQVNTEMAEMLVGLVREAVPDVDVLVDLHCGVGTFAVLLADRAHEVYGIERHGESVEAAVLNAEGLDHLTFIEGDAEEGLAYLASRPDAVVVDPPRAGLEPGLLRLLVDLAPDTIAYVSCEPSTLARDARGLIEGGFALESSRPIDMFPQTFHVESVTTFRRVAERRRA